MKGSGHAKKYLYYLCGGLAAAGLLVFLVKAFLLGFPLGPEEKTRLWNVEARLDFQADGDRVRAQLYLPQTSTRYTLIDENFVSQGYGISISQEDANRLATWTVRKASGRQTLFYRATLLRSSAASPARETPPAKPSSSLEGSKLEAARAVVKRIQQRSADLPSFLTEMITVLNSPKPSGNLSLLLSSKNLSKARMSLAVQLLALDGVPARVAQVLALTKPQKKARLHHWLEIYHDKRWRLVNPADGSFVKGADYLVWRRGSESILTLRGASKGKTALSTSPSMVSSLNAAVSGTYRMRSGLMRFSLFGLPINTQLVYRVLLMVPVGVFVLIILRNMVGIKTFGTFMPVLIAISFRETQLAAGIILFCFIVALGLTVRLFMERLKLLAVPRLAAVLIVVVGFMAFMSVMSHNLGFQAGLSVALFPMVILTMTIERMSIVWEERGPREAFKQGTGSLVCAALAYLVMNIDQVEHLVFVFPELLLILLAATLLLGRYTGYRLTEIRRFKALTKGRPA